MSRFTWAAFVAWAFAGIYAVKGDTIPFSIFMAAAIILWAFRDLDK